MAIGLLCAACDSVGRSDDADAAVGEPDAAEALPDANEPVSCAANAFVACADDLTARFCNATGDGYVDQDCGPPGCNAEQMRCNACFPSSSTCNDKTAERCDADGNALPAEDCTLACVPATSQVPAHCAYLSPRYLPDICDTPAAMADFTVAANASLDTGLDANCNGGVVAQMQGPALCVMRYGSFTIKPGVTLKVSGPRALAIVTDQDLQILGTLDVAGDGATNGPGGGTLTSGASAGSGGGGGAGFSSAGAPGGGSAGDGTGGAGGAVVNHLAFNGLIGGPRPAGNLLQPTGGGGGGAATLIACRATVVVSGTINAGGGGGSAGYDQILGGGNSLTNGAGGGAGGQVLVQGLGVSITGQLFANGGGGGSGAVGDDLPGKPGGDGSASESVSASGGASVGANGAGGSGARRNVAAGSGKKPNVAGGTSGGGGGGTGVLRIAAPANAAVAITPTAASPALSAVEAIPTR